MRTPLQWIRDTFKPTPRGHQPRMPRRTYKAAKTDRLVQGWTTTSTTADQELQESLAALRARSRQLFRDNDYCKRFLSLIKTNVVGPQGIVLENKARMQNDPTMLDPVANRIIEEAWLEWGQLGNPTMDGQMTWTDVKGLWIQTVAGDGEALMQQIRGRVNEWGYALHFIEADQLDEKFNESRGQNKIRMSIELDAWGRPQFYHLTAMHPGDRGGSGERSRLPAADILHGFRKERPTQYRGAPWLHTAMNRLKQLGGYEDAELISARVGASKMGFITTESGAEWTGEDTEAGTGAIITDAEPGTIEELREGQGFEAWSPTHPGGNFEPFVRAILRGAAAGMDVSYHSLTGDLSNVNYSSIRSGTLEMRDHWRILQRFTIDHLVQPVFKNWYEMASMTGKIPYGLQDMERVFRPTWLVRGWEWVDPLKDTNASILAIQNGMATRTGELAKQGKDFETVIDQLAQEEQMAKDKGVTLGSPAKKEEPPAKDDDDED